MKVTADVFNEIRHLINLGMTDREIAPLVHLSKSTVWAIRSHETYESYREATTARMSYLHSIRPKSPKVSNKPSRVFTEEEFGTAKTLQGYGLNYKKVAEILKRSHPTIFYAFKFDTYDEYIANNLAISRKEKHVKPVVEEKPDRYQELVDNQIKLMQYVQELTQKIDAALEALERKRSWRI